MAPADWFRPWRAGLTPDDALMVEACLRAAADGPFFPDWEFSALFGFERTEIRKLVANWRTEADEYRLWCAVSSSMNNLSGYPHRKDDALERMIPGGRAALEASYERLEQASGQSDNARRLLTIRLERFAEMDHAGLESEGRLVHDIATSAERPGVPVPVLIRDHLWQRWLPDGITGVVVDGSPGPTERSGLLSLVHQACRDEEASPPVKQRLESVRSFESFRVDRRHETPVWILIHLTVRILAVTLDDPSTMFVGAQFVDWPPMERVEAASVWRVVGAAEAMAPLDSARTVRLGAPEQHDLGYWKPATLGDLAFNHWD